MPLHMLKLFYALKKYLDHTSPKKGSESMPPFRYPKINLKLTGQRLKEECQRQNYTVKDIQELLQLGACQSIYAWFSGRSLPTLDNMYALSRILGKTIDELIVCQDEPEPAVLVSCVDSDDLKQRLLAYYHCLFQQMKRFASPTLEPIGLS